MGFRWGWRRPGRVRWTAKEAHLPNPSGRGGSGGTTGSGMTQGRIGRQVRSAALSARARQLTPSAREREVLMTDRLLQLIEPDGVDSAGRLVAWIAGGLVGAIVATATLALLLGAHIA